MTSTYLGHNAAYALHIFGYACGLQLGRQGVGHSLGTPPPWALMVCCSTCALDVMNLLQWQPFKACYTMRWTWPSLVRRLQGRRSHGAAGRSAWCCAV